MLYCWSLDKVWFRLQQYRTEYCWSLFSVVIASTDQWNWHQKHWLNLYSVQFHLAMCFPHAALLYVSLVSCYSMFSSAVSLYVFPCTVLPYLFLVPCYYMLSLCCVAGWRCALWHCWVLQVLWLCRLAVHTSSGWVSLVSWLSLCQHLLCSLCVSDPQSGVWNLSPDSLRDLLWAWIALDILWRCFCSQSTNAWGLVIMLKFVPVFSVIDRFSCCGNVLRKMRVLNVEMYRLWSESLEDVQLR